VEPEYEELVYSIKRNKLIEMKRIAKDQKINGDTQVKPTGDSVLHICAEYNQTEAFVHFVSVHGCDVNGRNHAEETPFIIAAREGKI